MRKRPSIASVPTFETMHASFFTPHPSDFDGLEAAPSAPSDVNVARNVARDVGRMRQYEHLTGAGSTPLFYISHNLSVEMGDFTDKLLTLINLSVRTCLFYGQTGHLASTPVRTMRVCQ